MTLSNYEVADIMGKAGRGKMSGDALYKLADQNYQLMTWVYFLETILRKQFGKKMSINSDLEYIREYRCVDLFCGSRFTMSYSSGSYIPLWPMLLGVLGADSIGVDREQAHRIDARAYTHVQTDLVKVVIDGKLKDYVGKANLVTINNGMVADGNPGLERAIESHTMTVVEWESKLHNEIRNVLVPGGICLINGSPA